MNNKLPNFLLVGAAKSATSSIYHYLKQHPDIFLSEVKEPFFLSFAEEDLNIKNINNFAPIMTSFKNYQKLFNGAKNFRAVGEASTSYLYLYKKTINNIKKYIPNYDNLKIIIILRNPVDRAYSHYMMLVRNIKEKLSFSEALAKEKERKQQNYHFTYNYTETGFYYQQVKAYLKSFPKIKIVLLEDIKTNCPQVIKELYDFLEVDSSFKPDIKKQYNKSGQPIIKSINKLIYSKNRIKLKVEKVIPKNIRNLITENVGKFNLKKMPQDSASKNNLKKLYAEDIKNLSNLIKRDLSIWTD